LEFDEFGGEVGVGVDRRARVGLTFVDGFVDFATVDGGFFGGFDAEADVFATYVYDGDGDVVIDDNAFVALTAENEHDDFLVLFNM
jgi:hypothetical protein